MYPGDIIQCLHSVLTLCTVFEIHRNMTFLITVTL